MINVKKSLNFAFLGNFGLAKFWSWKKNSVKIGPLGHSSSKNFGLHAK